MAGRCRSLGYVKRALETLGHKVQWIDHSLHAASYEAMGRLKDARNRQLMQSRMAEVLSQWTLASLAESPPDLVLSLAQAPSDIAGLGALAQKEFSDGDVVCGKLSSSHLLATDGAGV